MRFTATAYLLLVSQLLEARADDGLNSTAVLLPACAQECSDRTLAQFHCAQDEPCYCNDNGPLQEALSTCVQESCAELGALSALDATVQTQRLRADTCGSPSRDRTSLLLGICFTLFGLATLGFFAKTASRFTDGSRRSFGMDGLATVLTYIVLVGLAVSTYYAQRYGLARDVWNVEVDNIGTVLEWNFISSILYYGIVFGAKIALVLLYLRTWPEHRKNWFGVCCRITILVLAGIGIAAIFSTIFACSPIDLRWLITLRTDGCIVDRLAASYTFGGIDVFLNMIVFLLPLPKLLGHIPAARRTISTIAACLFGVVALACSVGRLTAISSVESTSNPTWNSVPIALWSLVECNSIVICCCIPALGSLLQHWRGDDSGAKLTGDNRPRWSLRKSFMQDEEAPFPNITPIQPSHSRGGSQASQGGLRSFRLQSAKWDEKSWRPSFDTNVEKGTLPPPREHQMEAMVQMPSEVQFPMRSYAQPVRTPEPKTPKANARTDFTGYYFDGHAYVGLELNGRTPRTGAATPILFNIDEENVHPQLRTTPDLLGRGT